MSQHHARAHSSHKSPANPNIRVEHEPYGVDLVEGEHSESNQTELEQRKKSKLALPASLGGEVTEDTERLDKHAGRGTIKDYGYGETGMEKRERKEWEKEHKTEFGNIK